MRSITSNKAGAGFGLLEIMLVLLILAILAAIQYPSYRESVRKARRAEGRAALLAAMQQQESRYFHEGSYITFSMRSPNGFKWFSGDSAKSSAYELSAVPCPGDSLKNCILLKAQPGTMNVGRAHKDDPCGALTFASNGIRTSSGRVPDCW